ncbi:hypothetical protein D3C76_1544800 [compost metagenome]
MDHFFCQFDDPHRLAHVQNEDIAPLPHRTGLDDQLRGFGNGHEVTGDFRMGDRQWATCLDLAVEQRDD